MTFPEIIRDQLDTAIAHALNDDSFGIPRASCRRGKVTYEDIIKALIFMEGGSLDKVIHEAGLNISASAFIQRRNELSSVLFSNILAALNEQQTDSQTYFGYRVLAIDGSVVNMARDPKSRCFVQHDGAPEGFCQVHVNALYDVLNKTYFNCDIQPQPQQDEIGALEFLLSWYDFDEKTIIVGDRAYSSYHVFALIQRARNADFLIRIKQERGAMREVAKLPMKELDCEIEFTITTTQTKEDKEKGYVFIQTRKEKGRAYSNKTRNGRWSLPSPYPMKLRIVRILLDTGEYETLATSLAPSFTPSMIKELYHARWGIETAFRELKYNYGLIHLHGKSEDFVKQEIYAGMIMATLCARIVNEVVVRQPKGGKYLYKVNQKMATFLTKKYFRTPGADGEQLMKEIAKYIVPIRPGRANQRKLRAKGFREFVYRVAA